LLDLETYFTEENGLLFLHALTCSSMNFHNSQSIENLKRSLSLIEQYFNDYRQVDAKLSMSFLSRRPFSMMWSDIRRKKEILVTFKELYEERILKGNLAFANKIAPKLNSVNYAEEYFNTQTHERLNLSGIINTYVGKLHEITNNSSLIFLLKNGILSTGLIRHLFPDLYQNYLDDVIESVDKPSLHYSFDTNSLQPISLISYTDALSPPWFLDPNNSMGAYLISPEEKEAYQEGKTLVQDFDNSYGEAILEMRHIKNISEDVLAEMGITPEEGVGGVGDFLTGFNRPLTDDANKLLSLLNNDFIFNVYASKVRKFIQ